MSAEDLEQRAWELATAGERERACEVLEQAHAAWLEAGERRRALSTTVALVQLYEILDQPTAARGWERRAARLIEDIGPVVEQGYLAVARAGCDVHDPAELTQRAELARSIAVQFGDRALELRAFADLGLARISQGYVTEGFALLDEATTLAAAREVTDPLQCGLILCAMLTACDRTGDVVRAEYWCRRITEEPHLAQMSIVGTHCKLVRGAMSALVGEWDDAEHHFVTAREAHMRDKTIYHHVLSIAYLAELRLRQGRYAEAAALLRGNEDKFEAAPALARLRMVEGRYDEASGLLRSVVRGLGSEVMRLAPVLAELVEVELRRGDLAAGERFAQRLGALEEGCNSNEVRALARLALARTALHRDEHAQAADELETALTLLMRMDRPLLTAQIRLELARALAAGGDSGAGRVEAEAALATFSRLRTTPECAATRELLEQLLPSDSSHLTEVSETLTRREREIAGLVAEGLTNREIAERLVLSVRTVETHVDRVLGKLGFHTRTQLASWVQRG